MSSGRLDRSGAFSSSDSTGRETHLTLKLDAVQLRPNGLEFRSPTPMVVWREMSVELEVGRDAKPFVCRGIVVSCAGDKYLGFTVCMLFLSLNPQAQQRLSQIIDSRLA